MQLSNRGVHLSKGSLGSRARLVCPAKARPLSNRRPTLSHVVYASAPEDRKSGSRFMTGFVVGGLMCGALGFLLAPQLSRAVSTVGPSSPLRRGWPGFLLQGQGASGGGSKSPEQTKQELVDRIAALNASIDEVADRMKASDKAAEVAA